MCSDMHTERVWVPQVVPNCEVTFLRWDDSTFPPRVCTLRPRLQARIPKCFAWEMAPGYDVYVYVDASFEITRPDAVAWLCYQIDDFVAFPHPERESIRAEAEFLVANAHKKYIRQRYENESVDLALNAIPERYEDDHLIATGVFAYRDSGLMRSMLKEWWHQQSRNHLNCQLSLPWLLWSHHLRVRVVNADIYANPYFVHTQNRIWRKEHA
jgi:hypothetical protein